MIRDKVEAAMRNRDQALIELDQGDAKESLIRFVELAWPVLEPEAPFVSGWAVEAVAAHLEAVSRGQIRKLLINIPPGCTKSMLVNVLWPAWEWGPLGKGAHRFISASYERGLAVRDLVRCRDLICSEWFQARWPMGLKEDQDQKTFYVNDRTGWRFASSVGGALTGYRGDRIIIDDPHDVKRAESDAERAEARRWFTETLPTRMNKIAESAMVMVMQRLHEQDLSGLVMKELKQDWESLVLPMRFEDDRRCVTSLPFVDPRTTDGALLWPERFPEAAVDEIERAMSAVGGSYAVAAQHQQRPSPRGGGMFPRACAGFVDAPPEKGRRVRGWDLAASKDSGKATAGIKVCMWEGRLYIEDVRWLRGSPLEVEQAITGCAAQDGHAVAISLPQDPGQAGKAQKSRLAGLLHGYDVHFSLETGSKEDRARPLAAQWEAGNVLLVRAAWNDRFLAELELFPVGDFSDQTDASSRAYAYLLTRAEQPLGSEPAVLVDLREIESSLDDDGY